MTERLRRPKYPLVCVEWDDAYVTTQWVDPEELEETHAWTLTVGWLLSDTSTQLVLTAAIASPDSDVSNHMAARITLPRGMVRSIRVLREGGVYRGGKPR